MSGYTNEAPRIEYIKGKVESTLLPRLQKFIEITELPDHRIHQLAKDITRFVGRTSRAPEGSFDPQRRELASLQNSINRTLSNLGKISSENRVGIDHEILYRPPFNGRFCFPEQLDYWAANENSVKRIEASLKMLAWAAERVAAESHEIMAPQRGSKNTDLGYFIFDMSGHFEEWTGTKAASKCYYSADRDGYSGEFFNVMVTTLEIFAPNSFHSQSALGKRIVRLLSAKN